MKDRQLLPMWVTFTLILIPLLTIGQEWVFKADLKSLLSEPNLSTLLRTMFLAFEVTGSSILWGLVLAYLFLKYVLGLKQYKGE